MSKKKRKKNRNDERIENPGSPDQEGMDGFGLVPPTGEMAKSPQGERPVPARTERLAKAPPKSAEGDYKQMAWRGFETEEEDHDPDISFGEKGKVIEDELDMTPMVDVTFLLLIFFMVTASFTLQKSIEQPPSQIEEPSTNVVEEEEQEDEYVEVIIDQTNTYYVTTRDAEEIEAPSDREMRARMRDAKNSTGATRLIIRAHVESMHSKVVTVWDAGIASNMERIEMRTTDEDF